VRLDCQFSIDAPQRHNATMSQVNTMTVAITDENNVKMSTVDQDLLNSVAVLIKAIKIVESEMEPSAAE